MTESDLKELGFKKVKVSIEESGDIPFFYFLYDFYNSQISLITQSSDKVKNKNDWKVELFNEPNLKPFKNKTKVKQYIKIIKSMI